MISFMLILISAADVCEDVVDVWNPGWGDTPAQRCEDWWVNSDWGAGQDCVKCNSDWARTDCARKCCSKCGARKAQTVILINFQPSTMAVPEGYLKDSGDLFGDRSNGYSYGWSCDFTGDVRDRNNVGVSVGTRDSSFVIPDRLDVCNDPKWTISLPNGGYDVKVGYSDQMYASETDGCYVQDVNVGVGSVPAGVPKSKSVNVEVTSGTLVFKGSFWDRPQCGLISNIRITPDYGMVDDGNNCPGDPTDQQFKVYNIEKMTVGYNIFKANPLEFGSSQDEGESDPIFEIVYPTKNRWTADCTKLAPLGISIYDMRPSCSLDHSSSTVTGMNSYKSSVEGSLSVGVSGTHLGASGTLSLSSDYSNVQEQTSSDKTVFVTATAQCKQCQILNNIGADYAPFTTSFVDKINQLSTLRMTSPDDWSTYSRTSDQQASQKQGYYEFINRFGTHYINQATYGSKYGKRYKLSDTAYNSLKQNNINIGAAATVSTAVVDVDVDSSLKISSEDLEEFNESTSDEEVMMIASLAPSDGSLQTWMQETSTNKAQLASLPIERKLSGIHLLAGQEFIDRTTHDSAGLAIVKDNLEWAVSNFCHLVQAFSTAKIDCNPLPPDASIYEHYTQKMQWTTGIQDGGNNFEQKCANYDKGNFIRRIIGMNQSGYGIVEFKIECDQGDKYEFTGNNRGSEVPTGGFPETSEAVDADTGFTGIVTWRQRNYGLVNFKMKKEFVDTDWARDSHQQSTQIGTSKCVAPARVVGLVVKQMTSRGAVNVRAICYDVGYLCSGTYCKPRGQKRGEFIYGYQHSLTRDTIHSRWVDMIVPDDGQVKCDATTMASSVDTGSCRWRAHPDETVWRNPYPKKSNPIQSDDSGRPADRCSNFGDICSCIGRVRLSGTKNNVMTDWKVVRGSIKCDISSGNFPDLDFSEEDSKKYCECQEQTYGAEVAVADRPQATMNVGPPETDSLLTMVTDFTITRVFALVGVCAALIALYRLWVSRKEYEEINDLQNEI